MAFGYLLREFYRETQIIVEPSTRLVAMVTRIAARRRVWRVRREARVQKLLPAQ
jgi:hypothetical protein